MGSRMLHESICASESIDQLTDFQENFFYRLIVNADDYGRMDARPKILKSKLYPLKETRLTQIEETLRALGSAELVILYEVDGKPFLQITTWDRYQRIRAKFSKYPAPDSNSRRIAADCSRLQQTAADCPDEVEQEVELITKNKNGGNTTAHATTTAFEPFISDEEAHQLMEDQNAIFDAAEAAGFANTEYNRLDLSDLAARYGKEWVLEGIRRCGKRDAANVAYLTKMLEAFKTNGGPTPERGRKSSPGIDRASAPPDPSAPLVNPYAAFLEDDQ